MMMATSPETDAVQFPKPEEGQSSSMETAIVSDSNNSNNNNVNSNISNKSHDARFCCNICLEAVTEPVVTRCGHLYCWPCLYRWLAPGMTPREQSSLGVMIRPSVGALDETRRVCPVCKAECSVPTVVPIYVRNPSDDDAPLVPPSHHQQHDRQTTATTTTTSPHSTERRPEEEDYLSDDGNMGLDIDGDDDNDLVHNSGSRDGGVPRTITTTISTTAVESTAASTIGLRQRRRSESRDDPTTAMVVPTRPVPVRESAATSPPNSSGRASSPSARTNSNGPTPNHHARATLSYGLVLAMHQTLLQATNHNDNNGHHHQTNGTNNNPSAADHEHIPSLHYPQRRDYLHNNNNNNNSNNNNSPEVTDLDSDPAATVFLSRLLLGLSLFVLFCLLSF